MKLLKELFDEGKIFVESEAMRHHIRLNRFVENHNDLFNKYFGYKILRISKDNIKIYLDKFLNIFDCKIINAIIVDAKSATEGVFFYCINDKDEIFNCLIYDDSSHWSKCKVRMIFKNGMLNLNQFIYPNMKISDFKLIVKALPYFKEEYKPLIEKKIFENI